MRGKKRDFELSSESAHRVKCCPKGEGSSKIQTGPYIYNPIKKGSFDFFFVFGWECVKRKEKREMEKEKEIISLSPLYYYYDYSSPLLVVLNLFPDSFPNPNSSSPSTIQSSIFFPQNYIYGFPILISIFFFFFYILSDRRC